MSFFLAGGFPMVFVLVFGGVAILSAARYALAPAARGAGPTLAYCGAVACVSIAGTAVDLVAVARTIAALRPEGDELVTFLVVGGSEALSPLILGFSLVAVALLGTAVGARRAGA